MWRDIVEEFLSYEVKFRGMVGLVGGIFSVELRHFPRNMKHILAPSLLYCLVNIPLFWYTNVNYKKMTYFHAMAAL